MLHLIGAQRCSIIIGLYVPSYRKEPMRSLHFLRGAELSVAWKNKHSALEMRNVLFFFMLPHFLNRESVGVLFTFWESLFENEISRDDLKGIVSLFTHNLRVC